MELYVTFWYDGIKLSNLYNKTITSLSNLQNGVNRSNKLEEKIDIEWAYKNKPGLMKIHEKLWELRIVKYKL